MLFHANGTAGNPVGITLGNASNGGTFSINTTATGGFECLTFRVNGTQKGAISVSSSGTDYQTGSDYRLKQNVGYDWDATTECKKLKPCQFKWIEDVAIEDDGGALQHKLLQDFLHMNYKQ